MNKDRLRRIEDDVAMLQREARPVVLRDIVTTAGGTVESEHTHTPCPRVTANVVNESGRTVNAAEVVYLERENRVLADYAGFYESMQVGVEVVNIVDFRVDGVGDYTIDGVATSNPFIPLTVLDDDLLLFVVYWGDNPIAFFYSGTSFTNVPGIGSDTRRTTHPNPATFSSPSSGSTYFWGDIDPGSGGSAVDNQGITVSDSDTVGALFHLRGVKRLPPTDSGVNLVDGSFDPQTNVWGKDVLTPGLIASTTPSWDKTQGSSVIEIGTPFNAFPYPRMASLSGSQSDVYITGFGSQDPSTRYSRLTKIADVSSWVPMDGGGLPDDTSGTLAGLTALFITPADTTPTTPSVACTSLIGIEHAYAEPVVGAWNAANRAAALRAYKANRLRHPMIGLSTTAECAKKEHVTGGICQAWVYIQDPRHRFCGPPPVNRFREKEISPAIEGVSGHVGGYFYNGDNKDTTDPPDPAIDLSASFVGRPEFLYSADSGPVEIIHGPRRDAPRRALAYGFDAAAQTAAKIAITIDITLSVSSGAGTITDAVVSSDHYTANVNGTIGSPATTATGELLAGLTDQSEPPKFTDATGMATDNAYGTLDVACSDWTYTVDQSAVSALIDGTYNDSITLTEDLALLTTHPTFHPFAYIQSDGLTNPEVPRDDLRPQTANSGDAGYINRADDFDPMIGRKLGSLTAEQQNDLRLGLQLCTVRLLNMDSVSSSDCC